MHAWKNKSTARKKLIQVEDHVVEVTVSLIEEEGGWGPYVSPEDAYRIDDARMALKQGDFEKAAQYGQVYQLTPVAPAGTGTTLG